ncbi:MAG TPA: heme lyase CcmF/NrfE family subunit [Candidatus Sulfotelmatobacter sp.]|nr:heme lyase CcmF/NrfE family subunit [Candidatus Sulfotelmatobacter sp.]
MIAELGHYALILGLLVAMAQTALPLVGAARRNPLLMAFGRTAAEAQLLCVGFAFAALLHGYIVSDFSIENVAANSHTTKPLIYKITGLWGNHEGSMMLWVLVLALFGCTVAWFGGNLRETLRARTLAIQGLIGAAFLAFILFTSNPFVRLIPPPVEGNGLNPILQDPGLAFHPPMLYLGYVGFSLTFSFAVAALIEGRVDPAWARWVRPWTLAAWSCLTLGIAMGSWWAYYELGWGGWWFWDPVENASFMPWLVGTALLHSAIVLEKRDALKRWTVLLAIVTFALSLIGTFLVRSGVLTSVHAFAVDPARGLFILALLAILIGGSLVLYALRAPTLEAGGLFAPISREGALVLNNLLLSSAAATVFIGTLYPLFLDALGGGTVSVGPPYFNATFVPIMSGLVIVMAIGPLLAWKRGDLRGALQRLWVALAAGVAVALVAWSLSRGGPVLAVLGLGLAAWLIVGSLVALGERLLAAGMRDVLRRALRLPRSSWGMTVAHVGMGISIIGMTGSLWSSEILQAVHPDETVSIAGYDLKLEGARRVQGPNYVADQAVFAVSRGGVPLGHMTPSKRLYDAPRQATTETAIRTTGLADLYIALGDPDDKGGWGVRIYHNVLVPWIWGGAVVMMLGGLLSLSDRRFRIGAPARRRSALAGDAVTP